MVARRAQPPLQSGSPSATLWAALSRFGVPSFPHKVSRPCGDPRNLFFRRALRRGGMTKMTRCGRFRQRGRPAREGAPLVPTFANFPFIEQVKTAYLDLVSSRLSASQTFDFSLVFPPTGGVVLLHRLVGRNLRFNRADPPLCCGQPSPLRCVLLSPPQRRGTMVQVSKYFLVRRFFPRQIYLPLRPPCGARKNHRAARLLDFFDRCGCSASLHPPPAALGSASLSPRPIFTGFSPNHLY